MQISPIAPSPGQGSSRGVPGQDEAETGDDATFEKELSKLEAVDEDADPAEPDPTLPLSGVEVSNDENVRSVLALSDQGILTTPFMAGVPTDPTIALGSEFPGSDPQLGRGVSVPDGPHNTLFGFAQMAGGGRSASASLLGLVGQPAADSVHMRTSAEKAADQDLTAAPGQGAVVAPRSVTPTQTLLQPSQTAPLPAIVPVDFIAPPLQTKPGQDPRHPADRELHATPQPEGTAPRKVGQDRPTLPSKAQMAFDLQVKAGPKPEPLSAETGPLSLVSSDIVTTLPPPPDGPAVSRGADGHDVHLAKRVAHQMVVAVDHGYGKPTEILLAPEELGRVKLSLQAGDTAISMFIQADRPETADLMRRNLEHLAQEFRGMGYENVSFHFADQNSPQAHYDRDQTAPDSSVVDSDGSVAVAIPSGQRAPSGALDLRL